MLTLSSSLLAAQKSASRVPYVKVEVTDRIAGVPRLRFTRLYTGSEPDFFHAAAMPGDGSLLRARVDSVSFQLYIQRVVGPGSGSNFGTWTGLGTVSSVSGIALTSRGATVLLFSVNTDQTTISVRESTDNGATFGSAVTLTAAAGVVGWMAAGINPSGVVALIYSVGATVYAVKRTAGNWGTPAAWSNSVSSVTGLACVYNLDWNVALAGQDASSNSKVWTCVYGDGYSQSVGIWSALMELTLANAGSNVEYRCPFLGFPGVYRLFFVEKYTGTQSYSRPYWSYALSTANFVDNRWREPVPFDLASTYGVALASNTTVVWLSTPSGVWQASNAPATVDLSGDVLALASRTQVTSGRLRAELRNDDSRYGGIGSGAYAPIQRGSELRVSLGYRTYAGQQAASGPAYWIQGWEYHSSGGRASFVLHAEDAWSLLERWRARRQFTWVAGDKNIFQLMAFILARAGLELSALSNSSTLVNHKPSFTIHPGENGVQSVQRLLAMVPDVLFFTGSWGYIRNPLSSDGSVNAYGTDHALLEGEYRTQAQEVNRVQVYGSGVFAESYAWGEMEQVYDQMRQVHDLNLDTAAKAQDRATAELREAELGSQEGHILVPTNCGQELYDVITITDSRAGLSAAKRRVLAMALHYVAHGSRPRYEHELTLGGV